MHAKATAKTGLVESVQRFAPPAQAPALLKLALDILGMDSPSASRRDEILSLCRALASEGTLVQEMAEEIARELARR
jgi:hypothetical protein